MTEYFRSPIVCLRISELMNGELLARSVALINRMLINRKELR